MVSRPLHSKKALPFLTSAYYSAIVPLRLTTVICAEGHNVQLHLLPNIPGGFAAACFAAAQSIFIPTMGEERSSSVAEWKTLLMQY